MQPHRSNALDGAAATLTVTLDSDAVWQCHCPGLGLVSLRAARERLHSRAPRPRYFHAHPPYISYFSEFSFFSMPLRLFMDYLNAGAKPPQGTVVHIHHTVTRSRQC